MNVRKRGLALLMCICMIFTLLPFSAFADGEETYKTHSETNGVVMDKTVTHVSDDTYKVTLEQYVEGSVTPGTTTPIDAVLVLDVSGSMDEGFGQGDAAYVEEYNPEQNSNYTYYIKNANGRYTGVSWCSRCKAFTDGCTWLFGHVAGNKYIPKTSAEDTASGHVQFFSSNTKITALKSAVNSFIDVIAEDNPTSKIAIVKFAGDKKDTVGNETYKESGYTYNYTQIVQGLTKVDSDGAVALKSSVNALTAGGATSADYGLEKAIDVFGAAGQVPKDRNRVVIMFTDGEPNHGNGFSKNVANDAIKNAQTLKSESYGASVYTIGIFSGAQVGTSLPNGSTDSNRYMHLVSSNYPEASSMKDTGTGDVTKGFYKVASDASTLGNVFTQLGEAIGTPSINLGSNAVLTDNIASNFNVPEDATDVKVYTADYNGNSKTFGGKTAFDSATVNVANGAVTVSGFDYSANFVSDTEHPGMPNNFGKKLIVEFEITVDRTKTYGGTQPANDGANITLEGKEIASVENPQVPVSIVNGFGASYKNSKTYDGKGFTIENEFKEMLKTNVLADGEKNDYVNITYTVTDKDNNVVGTYVVKANETTGTWTAGTAAATTSPDVGTYNYNVTCVVSDATPNGAEQVSKSGTMTLSITAKEGLTVSGKDYSGKYDGASHGEAATANVEGATIEYSTDGGNTWTTNVPTVTNVSDSTTVNVRATKTGYAPAEATYTLTVNPRSVTLTGESATRTYTGQEIELTGIEQSGLLDGHTFSGVSYSAKGTNASATPYPGEFSNMDKLVIKDADGNDVTKNYKPEYALGALTINPIGTVTVTIKGKTVTGVYCGADYIAEGYDVEISDPKYTKDDFTFSGNSQVYRTDVGTTYMGLKAEQFENKNSNFDRVEFVIEEDGYVEVTKRPLYLRADTPNPITYDGAEHVRTLCVVVAKGEYLEIANGQMLENVLTMYRVSGTNVGIYKGEFLQLAKIVDRDDPSKDVTANYDIKYETGTLQITKMPITITAGSAEGAYILGPITSNEWKATATAEGDTVSSVKLTGAQTTLGESPNVASDAVIKNAKGEDVTANYKITYVDGVLKAIEVLNKEIHFNYVIGYTDGTIRPNNDISRAEVATIFFRLLTDEARTQYDKTTSSFSDIKDGAWCCRAVSTLTNMGIIKGYTDGSFQPNKSITRAELATIIARFAKLDVNTKTFSDINGHWAQKNIELAAGNGWINGYEDGTFRPNNNITRAETFAMINRVLDRQTESVSDLLPTSDMNMWSDNLNENAWYYKDVQEATNYHKCDRVGDSVYEKWTEKVPDIDWASYQI